MCSYADDTTFHACDMDLENLVRRLEHDSMLAIEWFESNYMKLNQDKCHFLLSGHKHEMIWANIGQTKIWESRKQKLLGIIIDRNLRFDEYVLNQCKKAGRKLSALTRICKFMSLERRRTLMKSFIESQFGYCPLIWMFCGRKSNNRINHLHEELLELFTMTINHLLKIYFGKIAQCLSSIEIFAYLRLKYTKLKIIYQLLKCLNYLKNVI